MGSPIARRGPNNSTRRKARTPMQVVDPGVGGRAQGAAHRRTPRGRCCQCLPPYANAAQSCAGRISQCIAAPRLCRSRCYPHALAPMLKRFWPATGVRRGPGRCPVPERRRLELGEEAGAAIRWAPERPAGMSVDGRARASWARSSPAARVPARRCRETRQRAATEAAEGGRGLAAVEVERRASVPRAGRVWVSWVRSKLAGGPGSLARVRDAAVLQLLAIACGPGQCHL
jgi:hypothetical protein